MDADKTWDGKKSPRQSWTSMRQRIVDHYIRKIRSGELRAGDLRRRIAEKRAELFAVFDGNLEKAVR